MQANVLAVWFLTFYQTPLASRSRATPRQPLVFSKRMRCFICLITLCLLVITNTSQSAEPSDWREAGGDEETIWSPERAYWRYVENNDLASYSDLWHENFLGWPAISSAPVRKDHITEWITSATSKGLAFKPGEFKPGAIQVSGNVAFACYWITFRWVDTRGTGEAHTLHITHAWLRTGKQWRIIGGMSMPEPEEPSK
jgi:ketosteroid isomerase-like protein